MSRLSTDMLISPAKESLSSCDDVIVEILERAVSNGVVLDSLVNLLWQMY